METTDVRNLVEEALQSLPQPYSENVIDEVFFEADFDSFLETPAGEWTIKIRSVDDVRRLSRHIRLRAV